MLAGHPQRGSARGQHAQVGAERHERGDEVGGCVDDVLAVVDHQQLATVDEGMAQRLHRMGPFGRGRGRGRPQRRHRRHRRRPARQRPPANQCDRDGRGRPRRRGGSCRPHPARPRSPPAAPRPARRARRRAASRPTSDVNGDGSAPRPSTATRRRRAGEQRPLQRNQVSRRLQTGLVRQHRPVLAERPQRRRQCVRRRAAPASAAPTPTPDTGQPR